MPPPRPSLPYKDRQTAGHRPVKMAAGAKLRVLVVDDDANIVEAMSTLLSLLGHEIERCYSGAEAIAAVARRPPRVVLLDMRMPDMDGCETAKRLRRQMTDPGQMLLVAMSGYGEVEDEIAARHAGFDRYLTKPVGREALVALFASVT